MISLSFGMEMLGEWGLDIVEKGCRDDLLNRCCLLLCRFRYTQDRLRTALVRPSSDSDMMDISDEDERSRPSIWTHDLILENDVET